MELIQLEMVDKLSPTSCLHGKGQRGAQSKRTRRDRQGVQSPPLKRVKDVERRVVIFQIITHTVAKTYTSFLPPPPPTSSHFLIPFHDPSPCTIHSFTFLLLCDHYLFLGNTNIIYYVCPASKFVNQLCKNNDIAIWRYTYIHAPPRLVLVT